MRAALLIFSLAFAPSARAVTITVDATADTHPISPLIYGMNFATTAQLTELRAPVNRRGGNATSLYSYRANATNLGADWFYESYPSDGGAAPGAEPDQFVAAAKAGGAATMMTIPLIGRVAELGTSRSILPSFSVAKYGVQQAVDPYRPDAGNGMRPSGAPVANDPNDSTVQDGAAAEQAFVAHLVQRWGTADAGGVRYYLTDNEPSIWHATHRDVRPVGVHADQFLTATLAMSAMVKATDPTAIVCGPEEWGWLGLIYSGFDQQSGAANGWSSFPDRAGLQHGVEYLPWLLSQWKKAGQPIDMVTVHYYPQGGEFGDDVSAAAQLTRNRSTREMWDRGYVSQSWIDHRVGLIPRLRDWVDHYYWRGIPIGVTEYSWGADGHINGATAQADLLGIFGREGLDLATRWTAPPAGSPVYAAFRMYRNYDGRGSGFGETSVATVAPKPDTLTAFGATRTDGALTLMLVNKDLSQSSRVSVQLSHFPGPGSVRLYQITGASIAVLPGIGYTASGFTLTVPKQSVTLAVLTPAS